MSPLLFILEVAPELLVRKWSFINAQAVPMCSDTITAVTEIKCFGLKAAAIL